MELIWPVAPGTRRRVCMSCMVPSSARWGSYSQQCQIHFTSHCEMQAPARPSWSVWPSARAASDACSTRSGSVPTRRAAPRGRLARAELRGAALRLRAVRGWGCNDRLSLAAAHTSRASAGVGSIPRVPGRPIDLERDALREGPRLDQVERVGLLQPYWETSEIDLERR